MIVRYRRSQAYSVLGALINPEHQRRLTATSIAVIDDGTQFGKGTADGMLNVMQRLGKQAVLYESFENGRDNW